MDKLREECRQIMARTGLTNRGLANYIDAPEATIRNYLNGDTKNPSFELVVKICRGLRISIDELCDINPADKHPKSAQELLYHDLNMEIVRLKEMEVVYLQRIKGLRRLAAGMVILCILLASISVLALI